MKRYVTFSCYIPRRRCHIFSHDHLNEDYLLRKTSIFKYKSECLFVKEKTES